MGRKTHLRDREVVRADRLHVDQETGTTLVASFYLSEVAGCVRCVGFSLRTFLAVREPDTSLEAFTPLPMYYDARAPLPAAGGAADTVAKLREANENAALAIGAEQALGEPSPVNATMLKRFPFGSLLDGAIREYAAREERRTAGAWDMRPSDDELAEIMRENPHFELSRRWAAVERVVRAGEEVAEAPMRGSGGGADLETVARLYEKRCREGSSSPTRDVAELLGLSRSTVAKQVMRCRKKGLLAPTRRGFAGGLPDDERGER